MLLLKSHTEEVVLFLCENIGVVCFFLIYPAVEHLLYTFTYALHICSKVVQCEKLSEQAYYTHTYMMKMLETGLNNFLQQRPLGF